MKIHNASGTLEEAAKIVSMMSAEQRREFYDEAFKYEPSRPCIIRSVPESSDNQSPKR